MKRNKSIFILLLVFLLVLAGCSCSLQEDTSREAAIQNEIAKEMEKEEKEEKAAQEKKEKETSDKEESEDSAREKRLEEKKIENRAFLQELIAEARERTRVKLAEKEGIEEEEEDVAVESEEGAHNTDPVPAGKPKPIEWQETEIQKDKSNTCTLSVVCHTIYDNLDDFNEEKLSVLPEDGVIYPSQTVTFNEGESVFNVLLREMKANKIHMEFQMTPGYNSHYLQGINNIYEFDAGSLSGWMYKVNGWFPNYGISRYKLEAGDQIEIIYTCDLGRDIGSDAETFNQY